MFSHHQWGYHSWELKSCDSEGTFCGYASVFDTVDRHRDQVKRGAFEKSLSEWKAKGQWPKMLWQHDARSPIGVWLELREDPCGLWVKGRLLLDLVQGREAYTLLKEGIVDGLSIGYHVVESSWQDGCRVLEEVDLQEISLVTFSANMLARVTSVKDWWDRVPYAWTRGDDWVAAFTRKMRDLEKQVRDEGNFLFS
jgi:hypothetical protein